MNSARTHIVFSALVLVLLAASTSIIHAATTLAAECLSAGKTRVTSVLSTECAPNESCTVCALVNDVAACDANMICRALFVVRTPANSSRSAAAASMAAEDHDSIRIEEQWTVVPVSASSTGSDAADAVSSQEIARMLATGHLTIDGWSRVNDKPSTTLALPLELVAGFASLSVLKLRNVSLQSIQFPVLRNIHTIELSGDGLLALDSVLSRPVLAQSTKPLTLSLHHNLLTEIPARVYELAHLRVLRLTHNAIAHQRLSPAQFDFLSATLTALEVDADAFQTADCDRTVTFASNPRLSVCDPALGPSGTSAPSSSAARSESRGESDVDSTSGAWVAWVGGISAFLVLAAAVACALAKKEALKRMLQGAEWRHAQQSGDAVQQQSDDACYRAFQDALSNSSTLSVSDQMLEAWRRDPRLIVLVRSLGTKSATAPAATRTWLGTYRDDEVVIKTLPDNASERVRAAFLLDMRSAARFAHPNVVRFRGVAWSKAAGMQALLEYMDRGDLQTYLALTRASGVGHQSRPLAWWGTRLLEIALDVAQALLYLHTMKRAAHGALTSRRVLLNHEFSAKVSGFASVQALGEYGAAPKASPTLQSAKHAATASAYEASGKRMHWCAPEVLSGSSGGTEAADIYAFGIVLSELDSLEYPFERLQREHKLSDAQLRERLVDGSLTPTISALCPAPARELLLACLARDSSERPTAATVVQTLREIASEIHRESSLTSAGLVMTAAERESASDVLE